MVRNLKATGLALVAMLALGAVVASSASAQANQGWLTSDGAVTLDIEELEGEGRQNALTSFGGKTECPGSSYTGHKTITQTATEENPELVHKVINEHVNTITVTPHYEQKTCLTTDEGGGEHKTTVTPNGCDFHFNLLETIGQTGTYEVSADVECPKDKTIEVEIYPFKGSELGGIACTTTVHSQTGLKGAAGKPVVASNTGIEETKSVEVSGTFVGIVVKEHGFGCEEAEVENGEFHIDALATGTNGGGEHTEITLTDGTF